ncbi:hypothetical protein FO519_005337 [Halicephalobus sp. NKZ332]|nr:hypothetical protein FO519_005337 [Halicephalobus sp. NKZ332]
MSIIYRAFSPFPGRLQKFCDNSIGYILFIVFTVIFSHTTVITAITFTYTSESTTIQFIQEYFPEMALFQSRNMYFQIPPTKLSQYFCLSIFICYSAYYLFGGVVYGIFTYKIIKFNKMTHSKELAKLQMMLFKTTTFQGIFELLLVITPVYIMVITFYFQVRYVSQIMTIAMTACSVQAWLNYVFVMYNVVPYRKAIKRWFMVVNFGKKECCKNTNSNSVMPVTSIYNPYGR